MGAGDIVAIPAQAAGFFSALGEISKGTGDTIDIPEGLINIGGNAKGYILEVQTDLDPTYAANRDSSFTAFALGTDYYIYAVQQASGKTKIVFSVNSTYPAGYDTANSRKIGGFHYGRVRGVDAGGFPVNGSSVVYGAGWESNVTSGIVPNSVWCLNNRPICSPEGMAKVGYMWVDIYAASQDEAISVSSGKLSAGSVKSAYGGTPLTGVEGLGCYHFNELGRRCGKRLLTSDEWTRAAEGSPQGNSGDNVNAWSATANNGRNAAGGVANALSASNIVDCVGNVWEWGCSQAPRWEGPGGGAWSWRDPMAGQGVGQLMLYFDYHLVNIIYGGSWADGAAAGSRGVNLSYPLWNTVPDLGSRFTCDSL